MLALLLSLLGVYAFVTMRCPCCALHETGNCRYLEMASDEGCCTFVGETPVIRLS